MKQLATATRRLVRVARPVACFCCWLLLAWLPGSPLAWARAAAPSGIAAVPALTAVSPFTGVPGTVLTLTGTNLTGATLITFTGAAGQKTVSTGFVVNALGTAITGVVVPAGAQTGPLTVTTGSGSSAGAGLVVFARAATLAQGYYHTVALQADGSLWAWGSNRFGQQGQGSSSSTNTTSPARMGTGTSWVSVVAGYGHTVALQADGSLWAWGYNVSGQLGQGNTTSLGTPTRVGTGTSWVSVAAGDYHTVAVQADGSLWAWGRNYFGQLGQGNTTDLSTPTRIGTGTSWVSVAAGYGHTVAVQADGSLWACGYNDFGQLGQSNAAGGYTRLVRVVSGTSWVSATAGSSHTVAVQADGSLWAWGYNSYGGLGLGNTSNGYYLPRQVGTGTSWVSAAAGDYHTVAIKTDGSLWSWGRNDLGQLGQGNTAGSYLTPTQVGTGTGWVSAAAGTAHTAGEQGCRAAWAWGSNSDGQVGDGSLANLTSPGLVLNPVRLLGFAPATAAPGSTVAATGTGLLGLTALTVNGASVPLSNISNLTDAGFSFVVPAGAAATGTTTVAAGCGTASSTAFAVGQALPVLTSLSPASGLVGSSVTLTGTDLAGATGVSFNGTAATTFAVVGSTTITATVPVGATSGNITVTTPGGTSNGLPFAVLAPTTPLPVALTAFNATAESPATVRLTWATASEKNSLRFEAERSADGVGFARIGTVAAAGTTAAATAYALRDAALPAGASVLYYRLRQVDRDGAASYSPVRSVAVAGGLSLYPNPALGGVATLSGVAPGAAVRVLDGLGRAVATATADATGTAHVAAGLAPGVYVVRAGSTALRLTVE